MGNFELLIKVAVENPNICGSRKRDDEDLVDELTTINDTIQERAGCGERTGKVTWNVDGRGASLRFGHLAVFSW